MLEYSRIPVACHHIRSKCLIEFPRFLCKLGRICKYSSKVNRPKGLVAPWKVWWHNTIKCSSPYLPSSLTAIVCMCVLHMRVHVPTYEYMCSCTQMCMGCVYTCMWYVCMYVDQRFLGSSPSYFLRLGLSLNLELTELAGVFSWELQEPPVSTSPCWDCKCAPLCRLLCRCRYLNSGSSCCTASALPAEPSHWYPSLLLLFGIWFHVT